MDGSDRRPRSDNPLAELSVFFGVNWGNPLGTAAVVIAFCLVSTGVAALLGSLLSNGQQAIPVARLRNQPER